MYCLVYIKTCSNWVCIKLEYVLHYCYLYIHMWCCFNTFYIYFLLLKYCIWLLIEVIFLKWNSSLSRDWMHLLQFTYTCSVALLGYIFPPPLPKLLKCYIKLWLTLLLIMFFLHIHDLNIYCLLMMCYTAACWHCVCHIFQDYENEI
jgi:hypothetical protein